MTKLKGALPKHDSQNGLEALDPMICHAPTRQFLVIAVVDADKVTTDVDSGEQEATLRIRRIEAVPADHAEAVSMVLTGAMEARTGLQSLPLVVDPETGEVSVSDDHAEVDREPQGPPSWAEGVTVSGTGPLRDMAQRAGLRVVEDHDADPADGSTTAPVDHAVDIPLLREAVTLVLTTQFASSSMLQRKLRIGTVNAALLLERMESLGLVGPAGDAKSRDLLVHPSDLEDVLAREELQADA